MPLHPSQYTAAPACNPVPSISTLHFCGTYTQLCVCVVSRARARPAVLEGALGGTNAGVHAAPAMDPLMLQALVTATNLANSGRVVEVRARRVVHVFFMFIVRIEHNRR